MLPIFCPWDFPGKNTRVGCHFLCQDSGPDCHSNTVHSEGRGEREERILQEKHHSLKVCFPGDTGRAYSFLSYVYLFPIYFSHTYGLQDFCLLFQSEDKKLIKMSTLGNSLVVQWLGLHVLTAKDVGSIPSWGTKILQITWCSQK